MIVVSDTSPLSNLLLIDRLHLLPQLFDQVIVPQAVWEELMKLTQFGVNLEPLTTADWLSVKNTTNMALVEKLLIDLDIVNIKTSLIAQHKLNG